MRQHAIAAPQTRWHAALHGFSWDSSLYAADGRVFGTGLSETFARDAATGRVVWEEDFSGSFDAVGEHVAYQSDFHSIRAVDLRDGTELWFRELRKARLRPPREVAREPLRLPRRNGSRYVESVHEMADGTLVVVCGDAVFGLDAGTGERLWGRRTSHWSMYAGVPDRAGPVLFVRDYPRRLVALDPGTGETLWSDRYAPMGRSGGGLLVTSGPGHVLFAFDGATGYRTSHRFGGPPHRYVGVAAGVRIALTLDHVLTASSAAGDPLWSSATHPMRPDDGVRARVRDGVVHTWDQQGTVCAFDAADGTPLWTAESPWGWERTYPERDVRITVEEGVVVVTAKGGHAAVLDRNDGCSLWAWVDIDSSPDAGAPAVAVDRTGVYLATHDHLFAFDTPVHKHPAPAPAPAPTASAADTDRGTARRHVVAMEPPLRRTHRLTADPRLRPRG